VARLCCLILIALGLALPASAAAQTRRNCERPQLVHAPDRVTKLERQGYAAYRNEAVPADQPFELHLVGSYNGSGRVAVEPSDKPVVLVLASYQASIWRLDVRPGARLARVVLFGNEPQRVTGLPDGVEVIDRAGCGEWADRFENVQQGVRYMLDEYRRYLAAAQAATGLVESSFQGQHDIAAEFAVPPGAGYRVAATIEKPAEPREVAPADPAATIARYDEMMAQAPEPFRPTMKILIDLIKRGKLPALYPIGDPGPQRTPIGTRPLFQPERNDQRDRCERGYIVGRPDGDTVKCSWGKQFYVLGNANDVLDDGWGDDIVNPGGGDDVLHLHWGNDIVVLEPNWGDDIISKTCSMATLPDADRTRIGWRHRYNNFIVFGPGIRPQDMRWESKSVLTHPFSRSKLTIKDDCFNFVFTEDGELTPYAEPVQAQPAPPPRPAQPSPADRAAMQQRMREQVVQQLSSMARGDVVLEVDRAAFETMEKEASIEAPDGVARIIRRDGKLLLVFHANRSVGVVEIRPKPQ
jgi:hypothetical protein